MWTTYVKFVLQPKVNIVVNYAFPKKVETWDTIYKFLFLCQIQCQIVKCLQLKTESYFCLINKLGKTKTRNKQKKNNYSRNFGG